MGFEGLRGFFRARWQDGLRHRGLDGLGFFGRRCFGVEGL